jgi:FkbM family methyltransferase
MQIRTVALFHCVAGVASAWSCAEGIISTLMAMGYNVINCGNPEKTEFPLDKLRDADLIILSGAEWYSRAIDKRYSASWAEVKVPKVAWYTESFDRDDHHFDYGSLAHIADRHYFPAQQDAAAHAGQWLPFGVDSTLFTPMPTAKLYDAVFLGMMYGKRAEYAKRIKYPIFYLRTEFDHNNPAKSVQLLADAYSSARIVINLPSLSRLLVTKVTEVLACRTMLVTPKIDHPSAQANLQQFEDRVHLAYYAPDKPEEIGQIVDYYLAHADEREAIAEAGWRAVNQQHSLRHRLEKILNDAVSERVVANSFTSQPSACSVNTVAAGSYYLISYHGTVLYLDDKAAQVRHARHDALSNIIVEVKGDHARLIAIRDASRLQQISIDRATAGISLRVPADDFDFRLEKKWNGSVTLRLGELYLSADADGVVRNDRRVCREWEEYRLVSAKDEQPKNASALDLTVISLPHANLVESKIGRLLLFDEPSLDRLLTPADVMCRTVAARILAEARPGTIVDAGAGLGAFAIPIAKQFRHGFTVLSFEVQRIVFYQLCGSVVANSLGNVFPFNVGLSDFIGSIEIPIPDYSKGSTSVRVSIDPNVRRSQALAGTTIPPACQSDRFGGTTIATLDRFGLSNVRLIKLDVEGVELNVLRGARTTIASSGYPPILFASWEDHALQRREAARADLLAELDILGYDFDAFGTICLAQHRKSKQIKVSLLA